LVEENNKSNKNYTLEINEFAHLDYSEFVSLKTGLLPPLGNESFNEPAPPIDQRRYRAAPPASWDWRKTAGVVRPVQNQVS
jgi:hypothetical protein